MVGLRIQRGLLSPIQFAQIQLDHPPYYFVNKVFFNDDSVEYTVTLDKLSPNRLSPLEINYSNEAHEAKKVLVPATVKLANQTRIVPDCFFEIVNNVNGRQYTAKKKRFELVSKGGCQKITKIEAASKAEVRVFDWEIDNANSFYIWIKQPPVETAFSGRIRVFFEDNSNKTTGMISLETFVLRNVDN